MYISTLNNKLQDELSRLQHDESIQLGQRLCLAYLDVRNIARSYLGTRMREFPLILPTDSSERAHHNAVRRETHRAKHTATHQRQYAYCGLWPRCGRVGFPRPRPRLESVVRHIAPWPSDQSMMGIPCSLHPANSLERRGAHCARWNYPASPMVLGIFISIPGDC